MDSSNFVILAAAIAVALWNVITFALYAIDKSRAKNNKWRVSEATLIACAFLLGGLGAMTGMSVLRHKTQHLKFKVLVPFAVVLNIAVVAAVLYFVVL